MAGPTSTGVLAQYGATVVRVENPGRIDSVRLLAPYYGGKPGREKSLPYASINAGKLSVTLDLNRPEAREVILDLVGWADIVTESFSPKAMKAWGLDYESLRKVKPDLVMLSSCLFGQSGPHALMAGYGTMGAAIGGMVHPTGWSDQPPAGPHGAYTARARPASRRRPYWPPSNTAAAPERACTSTSPRSRRRCTTWRGHRRLSAQRHCVGPPGQ
jgi:benzylsuccinate CoA-transferase BbsF subunit